jgi:hypothetical protein
MDYQGISIVLELEDDYTFVFLFESISVFPIFAKFNCHPHVTPWQRVGAKEVIFE